MHTCVRVCMRLYVCMCGPYVRACVRSYVSAGMYVYVSTVGFFRTMVLFEYLIPH